MESDGNGDHVNEFTLLAISDVMLAHPEWPEKGLGWFEAFDKVDLGDIIREQARRNRDTVPQRHGIASALHRELSTMFDPANCPVRRSSITVSTSAVCVSASRQTRPRRPRSSVTR
jgi:hypothetical protein